MVFTASADQPLPRRHAIDGRRQNARGVEIACDPVRDADIADRIRHGNPREDGADDFGLCLVDEEYIGLGPVIAVTKWVVGQHVAWHQPNLFQRFRACSVSEAV